MSLRQYTVKPRFEPLGGDIAVLAYGSGIVHHLARTGVDTLVTKLVPACGMDEFPVYGSAEAIVEAVFVKHRGVHQPERTGFKDCPQIITLVFLELWRARTQVDRCRRGKVFGGLENLTLLSVVERNFLHIVEREFTEVNLSVCAFPS